MELAIGKKVKALRLASDLTQTELADRANLRDMGRIVGREIRQRIPTWKRVLAVINPVSWMLAR